MRTDSWVQDLIHMVEERGGKGRGGWKWGKDMWRKWGEGWRGGRGGTKVGTVSLYSKQARLPSVLLMWLGFLHRLSRNEMRGSRDIGFNWPLWKGALEWLRNRLFSWVWFLLEHLGLVSVYCLGHDYQPRFSSYKDIFEVCHEEGAVQESWVKGTGSYYFLKSYWVLVKMERFFPQTLSYLTFQNWCSKYDFSFAPKRKPRLTNIKWLK